MREIGALLQQAAGMSERADRRHCIRRGDSSEEAKQQTNDADRQQPQNQGEERRQPAESVHDNEKEMQPVEIRLNERAAETNGSLQSAAEAAIGRCSAE